MAMATTQCNLKLTAVARERLRELSRVTGRRPASVVEHLLALAVAKPGADLLLSELLTSVEHHGGERDAHEGS
jgi:hypothetical protein